jgi:CBS domain-containing protein
MTRNPVTCSDADDLLAAGKMMRGGGCGCLPISGASGKLVGFLTDRDVCNYLVETDTRPSQAAVGDAMHPGVWCCQPGDTLAEALATMRRHRVRRLPVLDEHERLVGILSLDDLVAEGKPEVRDAELIATVRAVGHAYPHLQMAP